MKFHKVPISTGISLLDILLILSRNYTKSETILHMLMNVCKRSLMLPNLNHFHQALCLNLIARSTKIKLKKLISSQSCTFSAIRLKIEVTNNLTTKMTILTAQTPSKKKKQSTHVTMKDLSLFYVMNLPLNFFQNNARYQQLLIQINKT